MTLYDGLVKIGLSVVSAVALSVQCRVIDSTCELFDALTIKKRYSRMWLVCLTVLRLKALKIKSMVDRGAQKSMVVSI